MAISTHTPMLDELLESINASEDVVLALQEAFKQSYVKYYLDLAVNDVWTTLDITTVPFKQYSYHRSMCGSLLLNRQTVNIMENIIMKKDVPDRTKAVQYKAMSEMLYEGESKVLTAILNKNLDSLYPNITFASIVKSLGL